jgi:hypothetical protein
MKELDKFTLGYIEAALWSESAGIDIADDGTVTENPDNDGSFQDHNFDVSDIDRASLARIVEECADFQKENERLLAIATQQQPERDDEHHGHDFWLTRNHHGAGFWDRGYRLGVGEALTEAAHNAGSRNLVYSNGSIYHE